MWSSPCSSYRDKPLEDLVRKAVFKIAKEGGLTEEGVREAWTKAVGRKASRHSCPASFRRSRLVVNVDGSSWLYELTLGKKELLRTLGGKFAGKQLKDIQFRIGEVWPSATVPKT